MNTGKRNSLSRDAREPKANNYLQKVNFPKIKEIINKKNKKHKILMTRRIQKRSMYPMTCVLFFLRESWLVSFNMKKIFCIIFF